ncbi:MBL fold metallo-hydrolase [Sphingopyxis panaciterrulae]|uniref:Glyoxylase-like metal-dependent hydrolase (Beta-lactamase superfamily II) n=1 Tax=Sphingopyxis panaciterrulae TaxID=462372 RepID=A0A7W9ESG5_9SPHN|nr:MBL fold metallo-hydrolase [Sphingopyxis panaciterrulae]MBB5708702.1 glyoxylase-like metal-dependent hydrolase (beta-lactamase superfamily II) [Sphingopyxis panaciterrulae]
MLIAAAIACGTCTAMAQDMSGTPLRSQAIGENIYRVDGGIANTGFVIAENGVIVIDAQRTPAEGAAQIALIAATTPRPIAAILLTHADPDHVGGLPAYPDTARIIAHENSRAQILAAANADDGGPFFGPLYKAVASSRMPHQVIGATERMVLAGTRVEMIYVAPAHGSGDLIVYFPDHRVAFAGDIVLTDQGRFPSIRRGGSSLGWIEAMQTILALDADVIVPGHGPIAPRARLEIQLRDAIERRRAIKQMVEEEKTLDQIDAALPPENINPRFPSFNRTTYDELVKGYPEQVPPWHGLTERP